MWPIRQSASHDFGVMCSYGMHFHSMTVKLDKSFRRKRLS